jgi:hypothetical protein
MFKLYRTILYITALLLVLAGVSAQASGDMRELYRIRVQNTRGGIIGVSIDGGINYCRVGRVTSPATESITGYEASIYCKPGVVAATAVHGIRIKVEGGKGQGRDVSRVISLVPREFSETPKNFGGHVASASGIYTDIPAGEGIFRNFAPFVGNPVCLETSSGLMRLGDSYIPQVGDSLVIVAQIPVRYPREILIENRNGGKVDVVFPDGRETVARVASPVTGVGRFDATGYTGVGRINTNHTGVLTISTAPLAMGGKDGSGTETRGGFMIQPSRHAANIPHGGEVMVVAPLQGSTSWLEGAPPLFWGYVGLTDDPKNSEHSFRVDIKTSSGSWMELPLLVGKMEDILQRLPDGSGAVTDIRLRFPSLSAEWIKQELGRYQETNREARRREAFKNGTLVSGVIEVQMDEVAGDVQFVTLYIDGEFKGISNSAPYIFPIDTSRYTEEEHIVELKATDGRGNVIKRAVKEFFPQSRDVLTSDTLPGR